MSNPAKPTKLRLLQGNPGKRPINQQEPDPPSLSAEPPVYLPGEVQLQWKRLAPRLIKFGLLTDLDEDAFTTLCALAAALHATLTGAGVIQPETIIDLSKELRQLWSRFGMTPSDRVKVKVEKPAPKTALARFTGGR